MPVPQNLKQILRECVIWIIYDTALERDKSLCKTVAYKAHHCAWFSLIMIKHLTVKSLAVMEAPRRGGNKAATVVGRCR